MTAKEKAKELFNKMYLVDDPMGNYPMCYETARQCALIAVDEILGLCWNGNETALKYWNEVKTEIKKL